MRQRVALVFKYTVYTLLIVNVWLLFRAAGADLVPYKALDQIGWLLILGVFEWETRSPPSDGRRRLFGWPLALEVTGYAFALYALVNYVLDVIWIDIGNSIVWLAISAMIWLDVLVPVHIDTAVHRRRTAIKRLLYSGTVLFAVLWGIEGALLDFYDAALWILCFFAIEMNLLRLEMPARRAARS
ncbi:hypothetical protein [Polymorphobacter fuscus]|uniref:Uncharacterized protein n=1 Tax=Sandarakinorhabdus fusca TaxID=1439888 RepID=A0A7C9LFJ4_9SPHN|nr:hypothetical protein [Polymorphobacter fuscus]KAB7647487.1 hypothetical protein F9290_05710 [Polymorphobacter fuscus]MQT16747.1 hypothetical protein [Polymorphobacter fuscus]NJC09265.1 hypothetical protein [Polymorphobacter fuscus]